MNKYLETENQDLKRQRKERIIIACLIVVVLLLSYLGTKVFDLGLDLPISNSILVFALININVILLLLLLFLTMRNLVKLLFERKKKIMGARLRTKLVLAFISLSLLPTIILFFVSVQFISTSIEYWYNLPIERSLKNSLEVGQDYYDQITNDVISFGNNLSTLMTYHGYTLIKKNNELEKFINEKRKEYRLASIKVFSSKLDQRTISQDESIDLSPFNDPDEKVLRESFEKGTDIKNIQSSTHGDLISVIVPVFSRTESKAVKGLIVLGRFVPEFFVNRIDGISRGLEEYKQFKTLKRPIKISHMITLSIVTLLIIFASVWFGFFLSKGITVPIQGLAEGTERIASGDYDFFIDLEAPDEIGVLVNSFNRMTFDLKNSKKQLEEANEELVKSNIEIERRRLYMEIILANVAAGVFSADMNGKILTVNKSAEEMLNIKAEDIIGKNYKEVMGQEQVKGIDDLLEDKSLLRKGFIQKQINLSVGNNNLTLLVSINMLRDDQGRYSGLVAVFDDLSEIEKAQRAAAWREVARRIAHEVKNPLTPIQLSAQRLKKRYGQKVGKEDGKVFEECTNMIINQAEGLKRLVNEFSSYARMPTSNPVPDNISQIIKEAVSLFQETQNNVKVIFNDSAGVPIFRVDKEQMKRVMINLLDNAIAAIDDTGEVIIDLSYDGTDEIVKVEVADNGKGIPANYKMRLFEPYFSTKEHGTGLGLAIVNTIINDHNGVINVQDNEPRGTRFIIELPVFI
ncbi:PAS domain-containing sensor histidine kinase [Thermodesulfobacteriota bacterium]